MSVLKRLVAPVDRWQQRNRVAGPAYAVVKKFGDDQANLLVVSLAWYGFTAIYPLLLVVVSVFGFIGAASLGNGIVTTLHQFPVIGPQFNPGRGGSTLRGSVLGLIIGVVGLVYGAQGVTQTAQQALAQVWNVPRFRLPGFLPRLARSLIGLVIIGGAFLFTAFVGVIAGGHGQDNALRVLLVAGMLACNIGFYFAAFWVLTPKAPRARQLLPGAVLGAVGFTLLTTVGTALVQHQLRHTTETYGAFASIIGVVAYLLLLAKLSLYAAELNPVLARRLWPRALPTAPPTSLDDEVRAAAIGGKTRLLGRDPRPPRGEEVPDVALGVHGPTLRTGEPLREALPVPVSTRSPSPARVAVPSTRRRADPTRNREDSPMRAALFNGTKDITAGERPDLVIQEPTDVVVRVMFACVCGSDLWYYRGLSPHAVGSIGHEFIGVVGDVGAEVTGVAPGDLVVAPFIFSDMSCPHCCNGSTISCVRGGNFGDGTIDGGQGEAVRVPLAGSTRVPVPGTGHSDDTLRSLLTLSDVMATGHHAAVCGGVKKGDTVAVVGDGAVGLSAVLASKRLGAERVIVDCKTYAANISRRPPGRRLSHPPRRPNPRASWAPAIR